MAAAEAASEEAIVAPTEEEVTGVVKTPFTMATTVPQEATGAEAKENLSPSNFTAY